MHGTTTECLLVFRHHPHSNEILLLSRPTLGTVGTGTLEWHCLDGVKGIVLLSGTEVVSISVV